jgi:hypothetical protein
MLRLKSLLFERVDWIIKRAPKQLIKSAQELGGNAFRLKLIGKDLDVPTFNDIKDVLDYDRYFGPTSRYSTGKYVYVVSDDLRKSTRKNFYDIAIYDIAKLTKSDDQTNALESITAKMMIGQSKMITQSDFEKAYPELSGKVKSSFNIANTVTDDPTDPTDQKDKNQPIDQNDPTDQKDKNQPIDQNDQNDSKIETPGDKTFELDGVKISLKDLMDNISKIKTDIIFIKQFQLLMNQAITKIVTANPRIKEQDFYKKNWLPFLNAKSKYGQTFGDLTKKALREFNKAYLIKSGRTKEEVATYNDDITLGITPGLLDSMFDNALKESIMKLSSILKEIYLLEQDGFDFSNNDEIEVLKTQPVKTSKDNSKEQSKLDTKKDDTKKKQEPEDKKKQEPEDKKKQEPQPSISNQLVRMPNGYISCTNTTKQLVQMAADDSAPGLGKWFTDLGTKKLLYGKPVKVRKGIDKLPLSGMQSAIKNIWRGYEEIVDEVKWYDGGAITADPVKWYFRNIEKGNILPVKIGDVKCLFAEFNEKYKTTKGINLYTYVWITNAQKQGCWVPTSWIEII